MTQLMAPTKLIPNPQVTKHERVRSSKRRKLIEVKSTSFIVPVTFVAMGPPMAITQITESVIKTPDTPEIVQSKMKRFPFSGS